MAQGDVRHPILSIVIPMFNEQDTLPELYDRVTSALSALALSYEVVLMDNHSTDDTPRLARGIVSRDPRWKYVRLSRNFGYQLNISAGLGYATGEAVVIMDSDLQDPPELIGEFVRWWRDGYDIVYGIRMRRRGEPHWRRAAMHLYYRLLARLSPIDLPIDAGDFRLISRRVQRELLKFQESSRYLRGLYAYVGFRQKGVPYERDSRFAGQSKFSLVRLVGIGLDGIISFSMLPIRVMVLFGFLFMLAGSLYAAFAVWQYLIGVTPRGWTAMVIVMLGLGGMQLLFLGLIGEYVGRTYMDAKRRPLWIVEEEVNLTSQEEHRVEAFELASPLR